MVAREKCARGPLLPPRSCPRRPSIANLSLLRQPRGDLVVPNVPQRPSRPGRGRLMRKESYWLPRRPIDAANAPGTCIMTPARTSANNGVPLASWRPRRSLPNPTLE
jgi:hypothetical protein